jgi:pyruvate dehydrogenase E1 component
MVVEQQDVFYYVTLMNENYAQPDVPPELAPQILRGCYRFDGWKAAGQEGAREGAAAVTLMGSGAILTEVVRAAQQLAGEGFDVEVFSVTSWSELARDGQACEAALLRGDAAGLPFVAQQLAASRGPVIAATDYVRAVPESIRAFIPQGRRYLALGTDGFGRSDTRSELRAFFGVDAHSILQAAKAALRAG